MLCDHKQDTSAQVHLLHLPRKMQCPAHIANEASATQVLQPALELQSPKFSELCKKRCFRQAFHQMCEASLDARAMQAKIDGHEGLKPYEKEILMDVSEKRRRPMPLPLFHARVFDH